MYVSDAYLLAVKVIRFLPCQIRNSLTRYMKYECRTQLALTGCTEYSSRLFPYRGSSSVAQKASMRWDISLQPPFSGTR
jgi:hypothetical protein